MKKGIWALIIILLIAAGTAYYFIMPAGSPVSAEEQQSLKDACIKLAQNLLSDPANMPSGECSELGLTRFACEAALRNDAEYASSGQLENDCAQLALLEAVAESRDKRNCNQLENPVLKEECLTMLS
jgi:hypothetical protein